MQKSCNVKTKVIDFVKPAHLARRAGQKAEMEESASHHVNVNEKCNLSALGASQIHLFMVADVFWKNEKNDKIMIL